MDNGDEVVEAVRAPARGVNVIGYLEAELGLGEVARKLTTAAEHAGLPTSTVTYRRTGSRQEHRFAERTNSLYDTNIVCVNAQELSDLRRDLGPELFASRYSIGVWFWELSQFPPAFHRAFDLVDEVWVASEFVRDSLLAATTKPVAVVPIPLEPPVVQPHSRSELGLPDGFLFLFTFDFFSTIERKNPMGLVEAFRRAFSPGEGPVLVIKSINGDRKRVEHERFEKTLRDRPDIRFVDGYVSSADRDGLMTACDCYVSLHHSEGLGLTMAEAMAFGKPVITTGYSGNLEFMNAENSYLVRYELGETPTGVNPYPAGIEWADPDLDHAVELMRYVYEHPDDARRVGQRARHDILTKHSLDRTAEFIRTRLAEIPRHEGLMRHVRAPLEDAAAAVSEEPGAGLRRGGRRWSPVAILRALLRRALWPELAEQQRINEDLIRAVRGLERVVREESARRPPG